MKLRQPFASVSPLVLAPLVLTACASTGAATQPTGVTPVSGAPSAAVAAAFDRLRALKGEWTTEDQKGSVVFDLSSGGSVLKETLFPGTPHEMVDMYRIDGPALVTTHFCAQGNQPELALVEPIASEGKLAFKARRVGNWKGEEESYMGELVIELVSADHIVERWSSISKGVATEHVAFDLHKKQ